MSLNLNINFKRGWPSSDIVERSSLPDTGVTVVAGTVGYINANNKWSIGLPATAAGAVTHVPYVFRNSSTDNDAGSAGIATARLAQIAFGAVQGISLNNSIEFSTNQYVGTPAVGDQLGVDPATGAFGTVALAASPNTGSTKAASGLSATGTYVIVGICTAAPFSYQGVSYIDVVPDQSKRTVAIAS